MYYSCHCIKRNGLQHDCRRTGCGGEPACLVLPDPLCPPSQLARARGLADPAPLAPHYAAQASGGSPGSAAASSSGGGGKRFIVCELKGVVPQEAGGSKGGNCCKCPCPTSRDPLSSKPGTSTGACFLVNVPTTTMPHKAPAYSPEARCPCKSATNANAQSTDGQFSAFLLDEENIDTILKRFETKELAESSEKPVVGPGGRFRKPKPPVVKEPCTRPGCVHWQPPPPCVWDLPCKADCFETPAGIQPGRNKLMSGGSGGGSSGGHSSGRIQGGNRAGMKLLRPECCTGCSGAGGGGGAAQSAGAAGMPAGLPVLVMKLC